MLSLQSADALVRRGEPASGRGKVEVGGFGCGQLRVDVILKRSDSDTKSSVGSLTTDATAPSMEAFFCRSVFRSALTT